MSQNVGISQTQPHRQVPVAGLPAREKAVKELSSQLPVELLCAVFEEYLRLDLPVQVLLDMNSQWRAIALETQSLWRRLLLSADAIPRSLTAGSAHACATEGQTNRMVITKLEVLLEANRRWRAVTLENQSLWRCLLLSAHAIPESLRARSGIVTKLQVTFVLGPKEGDTPTPEMRASLFKTVGHSALHRISFLCIIVNPEITLPLVNASLDDVFNGELPCFESLVIASAQAIGNLYETLSALMDIIEASSEKLKSLYLENVNKDFILHASAEKFWTRPVRITIRNEFDSLDAQPFSLAPSLDFLSFSGELVATPAPFTAHLGSALKTRIGFPRFKWLRVNLISMGTLARIDLSKLHTVAIACVQGNSCDASTLADTNRNTVDPARFKLDSGSPSRGDIATAMLYEAPDPSEPGSKLHKRPVFTGSYSKVYIGRYSDHKKSRRERFDWWHRRHLNFLPRYRYLEGDDGVDVSHALVSEASSSRSTSLFWWMEGGNASEYLHQDLSWDQRMNLLHDVAKGLRYLLEMDYCVAHGDLKPLNVLISKDGVGRLCDFEAARLMQANSGSGATTTIAHTGTVRYLGCELVECSNKAIPTKATDMHALGCLVLEFIYQALHYSGLDYPWGISRAIRERKPLAEGPMHLEEVTALPGDMDLSGLESEPYLVERFGVHVPNLSGQVQRLNKGTIFPGTYSTVYPGMYGDKKVAIKLLRMVKKSDNIQRKFRRELFIWSRLQHVNVLPLYGYFEDKGGDGFPSLISKWAEHGSAAQYIHRNLRWDQRASLFYDVAKGLNYLHEFEPLIVHADLKPQNVVVNADGVGQLCDFGLTRFMQDGLETGLTTTTAHTGTTRYLAYELIDYEDKPVPTAATDMYALGCLGLEFIYRIPPHASLRANHGKITHAIFSGIPPAKRPANPEGAVSLLWDLVEACWSNAPEERPTAPQVSDYLEKNLEALSESLEQCSCGHQNTAR